MSQFISNTQFNFLAHAKKAFAIFGILIFDWLLLPGLAKKYHFWHGFHRWVLPNR